MTRLECPFCGARELEEFEFHKTLPDAGEGAFASTYERSASLTSSREHWQHVRGCRAWLEVHRNPATGAVISVRLPGGASS